MPDSIRAQISDSRNPVMTDVAECHIVAISCYLALDGDDIGRRLERHLVSEDPQGLQEFAMAFEKVRERLVKSITDIGEVVFLLNGGDSILISLKETSLPVAIAAVNQALDDAEFTFSGGYGATLREAYLALKLAKACGKNRILPPVQIGSPT